jgi:DNA-directed RNA polymerase specialized sigma24 family protein
MAGLARVCLREWGQFVAADEEDIVQIAFAAFCQRVRRGAYTDISTSATLWRILKAVITRSAIRCIRDATRQKRGGGRVVGEATLTETEAHGQGPSGLAEIVGADLDPSREAEGVERFLQILDKLALDDHGLWRIALWKMQGFTNQEVACLLECGEATVKRRLAEIRRILGDESTTSVQSNAAGG